MATDQNPNLKALRVLAVLIITWAFASASAVYGIELEEGQTAPDFSATALDGSRVSLSDFSGKTVFMAFWATWCSRCRDEMEYLRELKGKYPELVFLAVNADSENSDVESLARMKQAVQDWDLPFTVLVDEGLKIWDMYRLNALPTSVIVGPDGVVVFAEPNFYWGSAQKIEKALSGDRFSLLH